DKELAALRKQVQQLSRTRPTENVQQSPPQSDAATTKDDAQGKQQELDALEQVVASLELAAKVKGVAPQTVIGYEEAQTSLRKLRQEIHDAKPLGAQVHGIGNKIQKADQQIAKLKATIESEEQAIAEKQTLVVDLKQQLETKEKARVQMQREQMELLRTRTPEQVTQAPEGSDQAVFDTFTASLEQLQSLVQSLGGGAQLAASCAQFVEPWLEQ
ncbi:unnamed protein product, partial [Prorocentrum cordatum]